MSMDLLALLKMTVYAIISMLYVPKYYKSIHCNSYSNQALLHILLVTERIFTVFICATYSLCYWYYCHLYPD